MPERHGPSVKWAESAGAPAYPARRWTNTAATRTVDVACKLAEQHGASIAQISLGWLLHRRGVTSAIVCVRKEGQLLDNPGAAEIEL